MNSKVVYVVTTSKCSACKCMEIILKDIQKDNPTFTITTTDFQDVPEWLTNNITFTDFPTVIFIDNNVINDANIASIDVSFISVTKLTSKLKELTNLKEIICLIKPQFECGKEVSDKYKGVPLNKEVHKSVIENVIKSFKDNNYYINSLTSSPIKGGNGNIEYLAYFKRDKERSINIEEVVNKAFF